MVGGGRRPAASAHSVPFASTFAAFFTPRLRLHPHGRHLARPTSTCAARTPACRSARTARRRWRLEDLAMMRAVYGSTVLYPSDANQTAQLVAAMAATAGISYLRTTRGKTPVLYGAGRDVPHRRQQGAAPVRRATRSPSSPRHHPPRGAQGRRRPRGRGHRRPRDRPLLGQADRRGDAHRGGAGHRRPARGRRGPLAGGRPGRRRCWRRSPSGRRRGAAAPARGQAGGAQDMPGSGTPAELLPPPASTPPT